MNMKNAQVKTKPMKLGSQTGSVVNWVMSGNNTLPVVGKGATELMWSDRHAYEVLKVSKDYKDVVIRRYDAKRIDNNGCSDCQEYEYKELIGPEIELRFAYGAYRIKVWHPHWDRENNCWDDKFVDNLYRMYGKDEAVSVLSTAKRYTWQKMNIIFGFCEEFYDFSF